MWNMEEGRGREGGRATPKRVRVDEAQRRDTDERITQDIQLYENKSNGYAGQVAHTQT